MTNGDKLVLNKLDEQISVIETDNDDELDEIEYKKVKVDYSGLLDTKCRQDNILKDLLDLPLRNTSKVSQINHCRNVVYCFVTDPPPPCDDHVY